MSFIKAMLVFQGLGMARGAHHVCNGPKEPLIPGIMPGASKPKIILAQDIDWPRYAYLGVPPESDFEVQELRIRDTVAGIGHDIAMGLETVCNLSMTVVEMKWSKCWGNAIIGKGLEHGEVHGCMTYTHTYGARNRFMEFSRPILKDNKPAGLLVRLQNGVPVINGANSLNGLKVVDVVGWAPTADTLSLAENKCTKERFTGFTMVQPTVTTANANNDALATLLNGDADAMWVYADQAKNYQCSDGVTANWDCDLWAGFGTTFAYIQTGLFGHAMAGTTLSMSKKGSGLSEILNPCTDKFILTKDYYDICVKHGFDGSCFENEHFPATQATELVWEKPTDQLTTTCADGYCPCPSV